LRHFGENLEFVFAFRPIVDSILEEDWSINMSRASTELPSDIRITDPYVRQQVESERIRAGESTATKTAARLIVERLAQRELIERELKLDDESPAPSVAPTVDKIPA
jgi:hypothetical protein